MGRPAGAGAVQHPRLTPSKFFAAASSIGFKAPMLAVTGVDDEAAAAGGLIPGFLLLAKVVAQRR
jgi:hypothetical protein